MRSAGRGAAQPSVTRSRLNHISVEEAQEAPDVVVGEFLVHSHLATILFDSGATYSFVSSAFASTHSLPTSLLAIPTLTTSPLGVSKSRVECRGVRILIEGVVFLADLIVLPSRDIDVILGMDWLARH